MSLLELERLVEEAEADSSIRKVLSGCHTRPELILVARRLGYRITRLDLQRAFNQHQQELALAAPKPPRQKPPEPWFAVIRSLYLYLYLSMSISMSIFI
jgi:Nif11 domain